VYSTLLFFPTAQKLTKICEGPENVTRGGVNGSQSKFLAGTWHIFQNRLDIPLFWLGQDLTAIAKLSTLGTGLGTVAETWNSASKTTCEINDKNRIEEQFISSQTFQRTPGGRVRDITARVQFKVWNIKSFNPMTQEFKPTSPCSDSHTTQPSQCQNSTSSEQGNKNRSTWG
jgi:hypothetical protein